MTYQMALLQNSAGVAGYRISQGSFITGWPSNVILVSAQPSADGKSAVVHLRETDGKPVSGSSLSISPLESKFYGINFKF